MSARKPTFSGSLYSRSGRRKYLTPDERMRFMETATRCARPELRTFCLLLAYTGCRISEALALSAGMIEAQEGFIAFRSLKKRNGAVLIREVPVPESFLALLAKTHDLQDRAPQLRVWSWSRSRAWQLVKTVMATAGVRAGVHATPKGLRHGFGLHAIRSGVPLNLVQRWLGHANMETTAIYLQAIGDEERELASRMWGGLPAIATIDAPGTRHV
jgi:integrase